MHHKHKIAVTIAFLVLLTAVSLNIVTIYQDSDTFNDINGLFDNLVSQNIAGKGVYNLNYKGYKIGVQGNQAYDLAPTGVLSDYLDGADVLSKLTPADDEDDDITPSPLLFSLYANDMITSDDIARVYYTNLKEGIMDYKSIFYPELGHFLFTPEIKQSFSGRILAGSQQSLTDLGFSTQLQAFINPSQPEQDTIGQAFKNMLDMISGRFILSTGCVEPWQPTGEKFLAGQIWFDLMYMADIPGDIIKPVCAKTYAISETIKFNPQIMSFDGASFICEEGVVIKPKPGSGFSGPAIAINGSNIQIVNCRFEGFPDAAIKIDESDTGAYSNIEIFGNTFVNNQNSIILSNITAYMNGSDEYPAIKIIGNEFESNSFTTSVDIKNFGGQVLVYDNSFLNSVVKVDGKSGLNDDVDAEAYVLKNSFDTSLSDIPASQNELGSRLYLAVSDLDKGLVLGNAFTKSYSSMVIGSSSDVDVIGNAFTGHPTSSSLQASGLLYSGINLAFSSVDHSNIMFNTLTGFKAGIFSILADYHNSSIEGNVFTGNKEALHLAGGANNLQIAANDFRGNSGLDNPSTPGVAENSIVFFASTYNNVFYANRFDETLANSVVFTYDSKNNYLYNVSEKIVGVIKDPKDSSDLSSAYLYYPLHFHVMDQNSIDIENAYVEVLDGNEAVLQALTGPEAWPNADLQHPDTYLFSRTKKVDSVENTKSYNYNVYLGNDDQGNKKSIASGTITTAQLVSQPQVSDVIVSQGCSVPPVDYDLGYKIFDPAISGINKYHSIIAPSSFNVNPVQASDPYTNLLIDKDVTFCSGLYEIYDGDVEENKGAIQFADNTDDTDGVSPIKMTCQGTIFKGKELENNNQGAGVFIGNNKNIEIKGCGFRNYHTGILVEGSEGIDLKQNNLKFNDIGIQLNQDVPDNPDQLPPPESQAAITENTFEDNREWNLLFINPMHGKVSHIFRNIFYDLTGAEGLVVHHPSVKFKLLEEGFDDQVMLYKDGMGNYWEDYYYVVSQQGLQVHDDFVNYKETYAYEDKAGCEGEDSCDGFWDKAYTLVMNDMAEVGGKYPQVMDKYPFKYSSDIGYATPLTSAVVSLDLDQNKNLVATTTLGQGSDNIEQIAYSWSVDGTPQMAVDLPMHKLPVLENKIEVNKLIDISGNNVFNEVGVGVKSVLLGDGLGYGLSMMNKEENEYVKIGDETTATQGDGSFSVEMVFEFTGSHSGTLFNNKYPASDEKKMTESEKAELGKGQLVVFVADQPTIEAKTYPGTYLLIYWAEDEQGIQATTVGQIAANLEVMKIDKDKFYDLAVVYDKSAKKLRVYLDGGFKLERDCSGLVFNGLKGPYFINSGSDNIENNTIMMNTFEGIVDEFRVYNVALSAQQVLANYDYLGNPLQGNNMIVQNMHNSCGDWKAKAWLLTADGVLFTEQDYEDTYDQFLCNKIQCGEGYPECPASMKCTEFIPETETEDAVFTCEYKPCFNDAECSLGQVCAFGKCLKCVTPDEINHQLSEDTVLCKGNYTSNSYIGENFLEITEDDIGLMCLPGTTIKGKVEGYKQNAGNKQNGIYFDGVNNIIIQDCNLSNFTNAIKGISSDEILVKDVEAKDSINGFNFTLCNDVKITRANIFRNQYGVSLLNTSQVDIENSTLMPNSYNLFVEGSSAGITASNVYMNNTVLLGSLTSKAELLLYPYVSPDADIPDITFYDVFFDKATYLTSSLPDDASLKNAFISRFWSILVKTIKGSGESVQGASVETVDKDETPVDVNDDGVANANDVYYTDTEGYAYFNLLANVTDKDHQASALTDLNPYKVVAYKGGPGAIPSISEPFTIREPTFKLLDLDTGSEFELPSSASSDTGGNVKSDTGGSSSKKDTCTPEVDAKCEDKYRYVPCVKQGNLSYPTKIFTCNSTNNCGFRLFVIPCEGNAPSYMPGCTNKLKDLFEEGIDCGGPCQKACSASCNDKKKNQDESDVDCGGMNCIKCLDNLACVQDKDCKSGFCKNGICKQPTCYDETLNQDEEGVDCGGNVCVACGQEESCDDSIKNQGEEGIDCGGPCKACVKQLVPKQRQPNYIWALLLLIPIIGGLLYAGYKQLNSRKKIPPMSRSMKMHSKDIPPDKIPKLPIDSYSDSYAFKKEDLLHEVKPLDMNLIRKIKSYMNEGHSRSWVVNELKRQGVDEKEVNHVFEESLHEVIPYEHEAQLKRYINHYLSKGMSRESIKKDLLKAGWSSKVVEKMLR